MVKSATQTRGQPQDKRQTYNNSYTGTPRTQANTPDPDRHADRRTADTPIPNTQTRADRTLRGQTRRHTHRQRRSKVKDTRSNRDTTGQGKPATNKDNEQAGEHEHGQGQPGDRQRTGRRTRKQDRQVIKGNQARTTSKGTRNRQGQVGKQVRTASRKTRNGQRKKTGKTSEMRHKDK